MDEYWVLTEIPIFCYLAKWKVIMVLFQILTAPTYEIWNRKETKESKRKWKTNKIQILNIMNFIFPFFPRITIRWWSCWFYTKKFIKTQWETVGLYKRDKANGWIDKQKENLKKSDGTAWWKHLANGIQLGIGFFSLSFVFETLETVKRVVEIFLWFKSDLKKKESNSN